LRRRFLGVNAGGRPPVRYDSPYPHPVGIFSSGRSAASGADLGRSMSPGGRLQSIRFSLSQPVGHFLSGGAALAAQILGGQCRGRISSKIRFSLSHPVGILAFGRRSSASGADLGRSMSRGRAPIGYDSLYPTFRPAAQAGNGLGRQLCRDYSAALPDL